jgi:hypothetical protein
MEAYFDESGTHDGSPISCVSGYLFNPRNARKLCKEWKAALPRGIECFHMTDCATGGGKFRHLSKDERAALVRNLIAILNRRYTFGLTISFSDEEFRREAPSGWFERWGHPYTICIRKALYYFEQWCDQHSYYGPIAYVFEKGAKHWTEAANLLQLIEAQPDEKKRFRLGSFAFVDKSEAIPIQAADLFAWEYRKMEIDTVQLKRRRVRKSMAALSWQPGRHFLDKMTGERLRAVIAQNPVGQ